MRPNEREVQCPECSQAIVPGDSIFSERGRLSHVSCHTPKTLTADERSILFYYCLNHAIARCDACAQSFLLSELTADLLSGRTHLCPRCRRDLTEIVRAHLYGCVVLPAEVRRRAQELRDAAQHLVKESRGLRDQADMLIREAEVALEESRRALWEALRTPRRG
jgi:hypothetical protein